MRTPRLLLVTDRRQLPEGRGLLDTVARCADAGARTVVLRELDLGEHERSELADALAARAQVISAHTALASASGVHLAAHQPLGDAGGLVHGRSCHGVDDVARAADEGACWVTVSPVATTPSKPGYGPPLGADGVRRAVAAARSTPVFALGGVEASSVTDLRAAGAHGVAVMGAVMRAADPAVVVSRLLAELEDR
jgi:thiamine-phosphate pyrophosphorylase